MIRMDVGEVGLAEYCQNVSACVTDQGTEHLVAECGSVQTSSLVHDDAVALATRPLAVHDQPQLALCDDDDHDLALLFGAGRDHNRNTADGAESNPNALAVPAACPYMFTLAIYL